MGNGKRFGTIVEIGDVLISEEVILEYFACDYPVCKGQCCIIGESGAFGKMIDRLFVFYPLLPSFAAKFEITAKGESDA